MNGNTFRRLLAVASEIVNDDLTGFDFRENDFLSDELKSQYISYIFSCSVADILHRQEVRPSFVSGYSMGIYAALYYCGTVSFRDGLLLVRGAWEKISKVTADGPYGMGMIVGLPENDIVDLINGSRDVKICNQNNPHTFIISGKAEAVIHILSRAKAEGALRANQLPVSKPYHSDFIKDAAPEFSETVMGMRFNDPAFRYVSNISREVIITREGLREEVIRNLYRRMNWYQAMDYLLTLGVGTFFECGAGDGLSRNFRFISGKFAAYPVKELDAFLAAVKAG